MRFALIRLIGLFTVLTLVLTACASNQPASPAGGDATLPAAASTSAPAAPASAAAAPTQAAVPGTPSTAAAIPGTGSTSATIRCVMTPGQNQASYKVREQLARLSFPTDAVGKTDQVSGEIDIAPDGTIDRSKSKFTVDLTSLQTDSSMRDNFVRRSVLQTDQYPQAVFVPTQVSGLPTPLPPSGNVSFKITGDMTLHGVTKPVTWDVTGTAQKGAANGTATTTFKFEDFNMNQPQVPVVLSVVDNITLEVTLSLHLAS
ncbi:MAG TPA: YceI family protein [Anaerolineaceae bacterium]|jgi:polyisoprenoid-binding protein YceI